MGREMCGTTGTSATHGAGESGSLRWKRGRRKGPHANLDRPTQEVTRRFGN